MWTVVIKVIVVAQALTLQQVQAGRFKTYDYCVAAAEKVALPVILSLDPNKMVGLRIEMECKLRWDAEA